MCRINIEWSSLIKLLQVSYLPWCSHPRWCPPCGHTHLNHKHHSNPKVDQHTCSVCHVYKWWSLLLGFVVSAAGGAPPTQPANNNTESQGGGSLENTNSSPSTGNAPPPNAQQPQFPMGPGGPYPGFPGPFPFPPLPFMPPHPGFGTGPLSKSITNTFLKDFSVDYAQTAENLFIATTSCHVPCIACSAHDKMSWHYGHVLLFLKIVWTSV